MTQLQQLSLARNNLNALPLTWIDNFWPSLQRLDLSDNNLVFLTPRFFNSSIVDISLTGSFACFVSCSNLDFARFPGNPFSVSIDWSNQKLTELPTQLATLSSTLRFFNLSRNLLNPISSIAPLMRVISQLCALTDLDLSYNQLRNPSESLLFGGLRAEFTTTTQILGSCDRATMQRFILFLNYYLKFFLPTDCFLFVDSVFLQNNELDSFYSIWTNLTLLDLSYNRLQNIYYTDLFRAELKADLPVLLLGNQTNHVFW